MTKKIEPDKICSECGTLLKRGKEETFCDVCKKKGELIGKMSVFPKEYELGVDDIDVCSWKCVFEWLNNPTINMDMISFISLPTLQSKDIFEFLGKNLTNFQKSFIFWSRPKYQAFRKNER